MNSQSAPVAITERAGILDALRGFAILGIFLDNIVSFTGYSFYSMAQREALPTFYTDGALGFLEFTFVHGKFYSLFSLLFGIGFSIILVRNRERGVNPLKVFYRRLLILFVIGSIHLFLLWEGDILLLYALVGCLLPLFINCSDKALLRWAVVLILSPILIDLVKVLFNTHTSAYLQNLGDSIDKQYGIPHDDTISAYLFKPGSGWAEWRNWQASSWVYRFSYLIESNRIPKVLGMFILGLYAGRKMIFANLAEHAGTFRKMRNWGFGLGIPFSIIATFSEFILEPVPKPMGLINTTAYALGVVPLSLAYVATICLFWIRTNGQNRWRVLMPVGRMALTNYLMQTVISITLFYGVGLGLGYHLAPSFSIPMVFVIYAVQIVYSNWWFKYFNYGPMEWIWRQLTYGKRLPLRKSPEATL